MCFDKEIKKSWFLHQLVATTIVWHGFGQELICFCKFALRGFFLARDQSGQSREGRWAHVARSGSITQNTRFSHVKLYGYHRTAWNARSETICDQDANGQTWSFNTMIVKDKSSFDIQFLSYDRYEKVYLSPQDRVWTTFLNRNDEAK